MPLTYSSGSCVLPSNRLQLLEEGSPCPKKDSERVLPWSPFVGVYMQHGLYMLIKASLTGFAPLWPLCGRGRFKAPGGTNITSLEQLLVQINGRIVQNTPDLQTDPHLRGIFTFPRHFLFEDTGSWELLYSKKKNRFSFLVQSIYYIIID